ncbi:MAG: LPS export ABC transporter periplasmic protein LptC [Mariprofundaceae bacterium]|nr:LPS export ABC transporter periplasmic protein LptC [Mariprofundaceae bacterium]
MTGAFRAWLKWGCLGVALGSLVLALVLLWTGENGKIPQRAKGKDSPGSQVDRPLIVERKGDHVIWRLRAARAEQQLDGRMYLTEPELELFTDGSKMVKVRGHEAWFSPVRRNLRFGGAVEVHYEQWRLACKVLEYMSDSDELHVPGDFTVTGESIQARGRGMRIQRQTQRLWVDQGIWIRDTNPAWSGDGS